MENFDLIVIGGGFSGILTSFHAKRLSPERKIGLISMPNNIGGLAYSQATETAVLNVPHWKMSALAEDPKHFSQFVEKNNCLLQDQAFARRKDYLIYLKSILQDSIKAGLILIEDQATEILNKQNSWEIKTTNTSICTQQLVLALGNFPPNQFTSTNANHLIENDPWAPGVIDSLVNKNNITIIGTGLTSVDLLWELYNRNYQGIITLISRRGLTPKSHDLNIQAKEWTFPTTSVLQMLKDFRKSSEMTEWIAVLDGLRPLTQSTWQTWDIQEQNKFLRHLRPYWDVARHRLAPTLFQTLEDLKKAQKLIIKKGRISNISYDSINAQAIIELKNQSSVAADQIINCSGSQNLSTKSSPLVRNLLESGYAQTDYWKMGIQTDKIGRIIGNPKTFKNLYAVGPLRKGTLWENIAVPELRVETLTLAQTICKYYN